MKAFLSRLLPAVLLLPLHTIAHASALPDYADRFFTGLTTLQADFEQQVTDANQQPMQHSEGQMWIQRPGRFRWDYRTPYQQELVADGTRVWSWDADLEQVTVQKADEVLTSTPAMLLSGTAPLEKVFTIHESGPRTLTLQPKSTDSNITTLELVFNDSGLHEIVAHDSFGNTTIFRFTHVVRNETLASDLFRFTPPPGADVVGDVP